MRRIGIFLRGFLMGICDLIPGISGGTIAFITGIYERLIFAISSFFSFILKLLTFRIRSLSQFGSEFYRLDISFLFLLFMGIFSALFLVSRVVLFFVENYFFYLLSFFIGLIFVSTLFIFSEISKRNLNIYFFAFLGFLTGILLLFLDVNNSFGTNNLFFIFLSGFIAVSALFLPGISGAYILLILGSYSTLLLAVSNPLANYKLLFVFLFGAVLGTFFISRVISFLFSVQKFAVLSFLGGLVFGSLSILLRDIYRLGPFSFSESLIMVVLLFLGLGIVFFMGSFKNLK